MYKLFSFSFFLFLSNTAFSQVEKKAEIKNIIEINPEFPGGQNELFRFIGKNLRYPANSREKGNMGTIYVQYIIDSTGRVIKPVIKAQKLYKLKRKNIFSKIQTLQVDNDIDLAEECLRIVKLMPEWKPGTQDGKPVQVTYTLPIKFKIE